MPALLFVTIISSSSYNISSGIFCSKGLAGFTGGIVNLYVEFRIVFEDGDIISIDARENSINLHVSEAEINKRKLNWKKPKLKASNGSLFKYAKFVSSASKGCVTDEF